ncbi:hypothetical protein [Bradyrhizobium sp. STM 3557]|uniref:hypothetical protein n=1 Tax=Bradyrhizobium sp. STM 3557 TaxID=578920 RepID=UPI003890F038
MSLFKTLAVAMTLSIATVTSALAQFSEPAAYQAQHPDRDVLNGGAPTPEARMRAAGTLGAAPAYPNAYAAPRGDELEMNRAATHRRRHHARF